MNRRTARSKALQALFQIALSETEPTEAINNILEDEPSDPFLEQIVFGTAKKLDELDEIIRPYLKNWKLERIGNVDRTILRMAVYEMQYIDDIPANVTINEAVELAKAYGDDTTKKFVNGVLSKLKDNTEKA